MEDRVLVLVPLPEEMGYIYEWLSGNGWYCRNEFDKRKPEYVFSKKISKRHKISAVFWVIGDAGNIRTAAATITSLKASSYEYIFLTGIAGSLDHIKIKVGDVVISNLVKTYYPDKVHYISDSRYEIVSDIHLKLKSGTAGVTYVDARKKVMDSSFFRYRRDSVLWSDSTVHINDYLDDIENNQRAPSLIPISDMGDKILGYGGNNNNPRHPQIHSGSILSGDMVIDSEEYIKFILERDKVEDFDVYAQKFGSIEHERRRWLKGDLVAVDMESYGFFFMAEKVRSEIKFGSLFSVRGISDLASRKGELDDTTEGVVREAAMQNAIATVADMIEFLASIKE